MLPLCLGSQPGPRESLAGPVGRLDAAVVVVSEALLFWAAALPPPEVEFTERAPKLHIYLGGKSKANETWIRAARSRAGEIMSLAAEKSVI